MPTQHDANATPHTDAEAQAIESYPLSSRRTVEAEAEASTTTNDSAVENEFGDPTGEKLIWGARRSVVWTSCVAVAGVGLILTGIILGVAAGSVSVAGGAGVRW
ncbi:hypothetical protein P280DRAFT_517047 [Massarina eburnea CBS 473.64]|uniref:Uncharacterized protein n=1 Tax=Massarina eburnea CBS 473.64 TaxID=1395130 RepID=A0A6A6S2E1_9PLEO|nr:hypothetical protein P280DRAFT_517047 [Massarina eburnea CBS 473.64]